MNILGSEPGRALGFVVVAVIELPGEEMHSRGKV
jgi:hypothetical protein